MPALVRLKPSARAAPRLGAAQAAEKLLEAAQIMPRDPGAMQLRYLSSLNIIAAEKTSAIIFPFPMALAGLIAGIKPVEAKV